MPLLATEVFTPNDFPSHTYVERPAETLEQRLAEFLEVPKQLISVSGPSKSGKTVLVEKVVGRDNLIQIFGAGVTRADQIWDRVLNWFEAPSEVALEKGTAVSGELAVEAKGKAGIPIIAQGEVGGAVTVKGERQAGRREVFQRRGLQQVAAEIANSPFVLLIDDFHYIDPDAQADAARQIKEASASGIRIITASVPYHADDVVRGNPELRGRVVALDQSYWSSADLVRIAKVGFSKLNVALPQKELEQFATESAGSPQLMQVICLNACFEIGVNEALTELTEYPPDPQRVKKACRRAAMAADFRSLVSALIVGPKIRGVERKIFKFKDGSSGDVYRAVLKAIALDPPRLAFKYANVVERVGKVCAEEEPAGSSISTSLAQMAKIAEEKSPQERVFDWDEDNLDMPNPYLLFYLRWSGRLSESQ